VTCWTCHQGGDSQKVTANLATLYNLPDEPDDIVRAASNAPPVDEILDKYIRAMGGAQRIGMLTSFVAKGSSSGYGPEGRPRPVEIYAKAPNQRTTIIHTDNGDNTTVYDGRSGWIAAPLRPVPVLAMSGGALEGAKLDAELAFPGRIKNALTKWRVGFSTTINDREVQVVQEPLPAVLSQRCISSESVCWLASCGIRILQSDGHRRKSTIPIIAMSPASRCRSALQSAGSMGKRTSS
jgi:hypothetical protein